MGKVKKKQVTTVVYLLLLLLQPLWLWLIPKPVGYESIWLAAFLTLPLLIPLKGILAGSLRKGIIGAYLSLPHLMFAISEAWARPAGRWLAVFQLVLLISYWLLLISRGRQRKAQLSSQPEHQ